VVRKSKKDIAQIRPLAFELPVFFVLFQAMTLKWELEVKEFRGHSPGVDEQNKKVHPTRTFLLRVISIPQIVTDSQTHTEIHFHHNTRKTSDRN
jgi:hypothetical protein